MKFICALLFVGAVAAQTAAPAQPNPNIALVEALEKRADSLLKDVNAFLQQHRASGNPFLHAVERQAILIEALDLDLKNLLAQKDIAQQIHHLHVIEEELLHLENRVAEEIDILRRFDFFQSGQGHRGETGPQLIARGQQLVKDAQAAIAAHPQAKEVKEIQSDIIIVESLIKAIQAKPAPTAADLLKDETELFRYEQTLRQLIQKVNARS